MDIKNKNKFLNALRRNLENKISNLIIIYFYDEQSKNSPEFYVCILKFVFILEKQKPQLALRFFTLFPFKASDGETPTYVPM